MIAIYKMTGFLRLPACRFYPSCSSYFYTAIERHGLIQGGLLGVGRLLRCHPFNPGGLDPVPEQPLGGFFCKLNCFNILASSASTDSTK